MVTAEPPEENIEAIHVSILILCVSLIFVLDIIANT
jgi:hypothetical protein